MIPDHSALTQALEAVEFVHHVALSGRKGPRHGVTEREAYFYDKGYDDALNGVRDTLRLTVASDEEDPNG